VIQGTYLGKVLGLDRVSVLEFGVAGGRGLRSLEEVAKKVEEIYGTKIDVYGFDTGEGLPKPDDYRDLTNLFSEGTFVMDVDKLKGSLSKANLVLGLVKETIQGFMKSNPAPVAFVSIDLDLYSSTLHALQLFEGSYDLLLPRVYMYLDDIMGRTCCEFNGERLAVAEFNDAHEKKTIAPVHGLRFFLPPEYRQSMWTEKIYMAHFFDHERYGHSDGLARNKALAITV